MPSRAIRVLIADDHQMFRQTLRRALESGAEADIEVVGEAGDGHQVMALLGRVAADILLLDLNMPGLSGLDVLNALSEQQAAIRTIVLTGSNQRDEMVRAVRAGAHGVVLKDASIESLIESIRHVESGHYWISQDRMDDLLGSLASGRSKPAPPRPVETLTARERQIIAAIALGLTNKEVSAELKLSDQTVKNHLSNIFDKVGVANRLELALFALHHGLAPDS